MLSGRNDTTITEIAREHFGVSGNDLYDAPATIQTHYLWWICAVVGINGFMALLIAKVLLHTTGVCTGFGSSCDTIFLAEASSPRLHVIVESLIWGAADLGIVMVWISHRRESLRLKRLAAVVARDSPSDDCSGHHLVIVPHRVEEGVIQIETSGVSAPAWLDLEMGS